MGSEHGLSVGDWVGIVSLSVTIFGAVIGTIVKCVSWVVGREMSGMHKGISDTTTQMQSVVSDMGEIKAGVAYLKEEQHKTGEAFVRVWHKFDEHDKRLWELSRRRKKAANTAVTESR